MAFLYILEYLVMAMVWLVILTQVILPLLWDTPLFPIFRGSIQHRADLAEVKQAEEEFLLEESIQERWDNLNESLDELERKNASKQPKQSNQEADDTV